MYCLPISAFDLRTNNRRLFKISYSGAFAIVYTPPPPPPNHATVFAYGFERFATPRATFSRVFRNSFDFAAHGPTRKPETFAFRRMRSRHVVT
jgi:hypothetical protein